MIVGNSPHFVIGLYGALRVGATVIPINPIYTADEISYMLQDGDVKGVIAVDLLLPVLKKIIGHTPFLEHVILCETTDTVENMPSYFHTFSQVVNRGEATYDFLELKEEDVAIILYTSGTTGKPKGAMLTHKNIYSNAQDVADYLSINGNDRVVAALPMFHVFCLTVSLNAPLMNGGTILIEPKFSPSSIFELIQNRQATIFAGVPTMYNFLLQHDKGKKSNFTR